MILLQGDTTDLLDSRLWFYLIFAALSVIGGIFGKKKKDKAEAAKRKQQQGRAPQARPRSPTPQRTPQPPRPARPTPPVEARRPHTRAPPHPATRRQPTQPVPARPRPVQARPGSLPEWAAARLPSWEQPDALIGERIEEASAVGQLTTLPSDTLAPVDSAKPARKRPTAEGEQVRRLLRDTSGLRSAFILSEILASPVALRENRQV